MVSALNVSLILEDPTNEECDPCINIREAATAILIKTRSYTDQDFIMDQWAAHVTIAY